MIIGIDASNIGSGGGINHLKFLLDNLICDQSINKIILIHNYKFHFNTKTDKLSLINPWYSRFTSFSLFFQYISHDKIFKNNKCDVVFIPGGIYLGKFTPLVSLSQNLLPFSLNEIKKYKNYFLRIKLNLIRLLQVHTFNKSNGLIYLHKNAQNIISKFLNTNKEFKIIPHGIYENEFIQLKGKPKNFLYVSDFHEYKNHNNLIQAFNKLVDEGYDIKLKLIGNLKGFSLKNIKKRNIEILGSINHEDVLNHYKKSDAFIFMSSCENLPIALLEAISFGLPVISSNVEPMTSVLDSSNIFVNPHKIDEIRNGIINLISNQSISNIKMVNYRDSKKYNWNNCSIETIKYLFKVKKTQRKAIKN